MCKPVRNRLGEEMKQGEICIISVTSTRAIYIRTGVYLDLKLDALIQSLKPFTQTNIAKDDHC
jgi:hypothetical protein